ncbi:hypothetical protein NMY22_g9678 [Coprinellus aureogranulatus]|nr:hypothetical protein NMY22_g9678 [Coprinellus aureogranulatus]
MAIPNLVNAAPQTPHLRHNIPLPTLLPNGASRADLHPALRMGAAPLAMTWDTHTPLYHNTASQPPWLAHPATFPASTSMVLRDATRTSDVDDKPLVIFPDTDSADGTVTVKDVLDAVHRLVASERPGSAAAGESHLHFWVGLMPSMSEREVWVLHLA